VPFTIRLSVYRNGESAVIYAYTDTDPPVEIDGTKTRQIEFQHTSSLKSLQRCIVLPKNHDEDYIVEFNVNMSFQAFYKKLQECDDNNFKKYKLFTHNCANAAASVLDMAGVKLKLPGKFHFNRINETSYFRIPFSLTPYELFLAARDAKNQSQQNQKIYLEIKKAIWKLNFFKKQTNFVLRENIDKIIFSIKKKLEKNPHHANFYLDAVRDTTAMLLHTIQEVPKERLGSSQLSIEHKREPSPQVSIDKKIYIRKATFFHKRLPSHSKRYWDEFLILNLMLMLCVMTTTSIITPSLESRHFIERSICYSVWLSCVNIISVGLHQKHINKRITEEDKNLHTRVETGLSKTMHDFSEQVVEKRLRR
jgi:hypothetical protein